MPTNGGGGSIHIVITVYLATVTVHVLSDSSCVIANNIRPREIIIIN